MVKAWDIPGVAVPESSGCCFLDALDWEKRTTTARTALPCWKKTLESEADDGNFRWAGDWGAARKTPVWARCSQPEAGQRHLDASSGAGPSHGWTEAAVGLDLGDKSRRHFARFARTSEQDPGQAEGKERAPCAVRRPTCKFPYNVSIDRTAIPFHEAAAAANKPTVTDCVTFCNLIYRTEQKPATNNVAELNRNSSRASRDRQQCNCNGNCHCGCGYCVRVTSLPGLRRSYVPELGLVRPGPGPSEINLQQAEHGAWAV
jgi:hypothetical protein